MRSQKQRARQDAEYRRGGKYARVNPCYACGKSAGVEYFSHPLTDCTSPKGHNWGDLALCLCAKCSAATQEMQEPAEFREYAKTLKAAQSLGRLGGKKKSPAKTKAAKRNGASGGRPRTICLWCGKSHQGKPPKRCKDSSRLMSAVCGKIEVWKAMRVLEVYGVPGLQALAIELRVAK